MTKWISIVLLSSLSFFQVACKTSSQPKAGPGDASSVKEKSNATAAKIGSLLVADCNGTFYRYPNVPKAEFAAIAIQAEPMSEKQRFFGY